MGAEDVLVVVRPPPENSAYHAPELPLRAGLERLAGEDPVRAVVIHGPTSSAKSSRSRRREHRVRAAIDAQSLIAFADLVVSAGGTMNRGGGAWNPVWTIFSGRMGRSTRR